MKFLSELRYDFVHMNCETLTFLLTHDGVLAKEDIDESNVFLPSIVKLPLDRVNDLSVSLFLPLTLAQEGCPCASFSWRSARWRYRRGSDVLPSRMFRLPDIQQWEGWESDSFNPVCPKFRKRTIFQHAERVQVKVARVTWPVDTCDSVFLKLVV